MIKKQTLKSRPACKLTFELPPDYEADELELLAEWNDWKPVPFNRLKSGKWKLQDEVEPGQDYQFCYRGRTNGEEWYDCDPDADRTVPTEYGSQNSVISC